VVIIFITCAATSGSALALASVIIFVSSPRVFIGVAVIFFAVEHFFIPNWFQSSPEEVDAHFDSSASALELSGRGRLRCCRHLLDHKQESTFSGNVNGGTTFSTTTHGERWRCLLVTQ
jgi:hypothetical protein